MTAESCTVLIIGGGPAGLAAALELHRLGVRGVKVIEREAEAGGVPRLCHHTGFGWRDLRRFWRGPDYARAYRQRTEAAGVEIKTASMVTGWDDRRAVKVTGPTGVQRIEAKAILLATGCRERPAAARLTPGNRPAGLFTTGSLQHFIHEYGQAVGRRAVVVGAELVSLSAVLTLAGAGIEIAAMITEHPHHQIYFPFSAALWLAMQRLGVQIMTSAHILRIHGRGRVEAIETADIVGDGRRTIPCDMVVFSGNWIPEHELARAGGLLLDPATRGPQVDAAMRTSAPGVFAAGNLLHGAQTADYAALEGRCAAQSITRFLAGARWPQAGPIIQVDAPVAWVTPNRISSVPTPGKTWFVFQTEQFCQQVQAQIYQGARLLFAQSFARLMPNRSYYLPDHWLQKLDLEGEPLRLTLVHG
jgi:NADPH-dependent 2,4-dienoyl-CoA reductase/sulfur reductase-like enzyme